MAGYDDIDPEEQFTEFQPSGVHSIPLIPGRCSGHDRLSAAVAGVARDLKRVIASAEHSDHALAEKSDRIVAKIDGLSEELKTTQLQLSRDLGEREAAERGRSKAPQWLALAVSVFVALLSLLSLIAGGAALLLRGGGH